MGASSLGALALTPARIIRAASSEESQLLVFADMEVNEFTDYLEPASPYWLPIRRHNNSPLITSTHARSGSRSLRIYLNRLTSTTNFRSQFNPIGAAKADGHEISMQFGKTYWIGFSLYIPSDWEANSTLGELLWQIHDRPLDYSYAKQPIVAGYVDAIGRYGEVNNWNIVVRYVLENEEVDPVGTVRTSFRDNAQSVLDDVGKWTDWVIEYRPDWRPLSEGGIGVTRIWRDGLKVVDYIGPNAYNQVRGPYLSLGCYKWDWKRDYADSVTERTYYYDELRVSRPDVGSYELVAPGGAMDMALPKPPIMTVG